MDYVLIFMAGVAFGAFLLVVLISNMSPPRY